MAERAIQPRVSVVIPTYNRRDLLPEAVESCLRQSRSEVEIIIVDDGSTDGTGEYVDRMLTSSWAKRSVVYQRQENAGAPSARNHGLRLARAEYIQFLDSDDLLMPTKFARQIAALEDPRCNDAPCCHCYGSIQLRFGGDGVSRRIGMPITDASALIRCLCSRAVHVLQTAGPLWRRAFLISRPGWLEGISIGDDLEYYARLLVDARQVCFVDDELFIVREHSGDRVGVGGSTASSIRSLLKVRHSVLESVKRAGLWDEHSQKAFLGAMRTIYANALGTGDAEIVRDLELWLLEIAAAPRRRAGVQAMIGIRRLLGGALLLRAHRIARRLRAA